MNVKSADRTGKSRRSAKPYSQRIAQRRNELGMTQEKLAKVAGVNAKTVYRAEKGENIDMEFLDFIAQGLGLTFRDVTCPDFTGGNGPEFWLNEVEQADKAGDFSTACRIGRALVDNLIPKDDRLFLTASVRLAIVYDHRRDWEKALAALDLCLNTEFPTGSPADRAWAYFQRGLIRRDFAEDLLSRTHWTFSDRINELLRSAEVDLRKAMEFKAHGLDVAARHQMGVLEVLHGNYEQALAKFQSCLEERQAAAADTSGDLAVTYRQAYEHRRIACCLAHLAFRSADAQQGSNFRHEAQYHFSEAKRLAIDSDHGRLVRDLGRDLQAWGFDEP